MTTTMETTQAETEHERAELHALIDKASLPVVRWATYATRAALAEYAKPAPLPVPPGDDDDDDDADDDAAPSGQ